MDLTQATKVSKLLKRSSKYNRKVKVRGIIGNSRGYHVQVTDKKDGRPFNYPVERP